MSKTYRVCTRCTPPHVENCETCYGWGLHDGKPIRASAVDVITECQACPECGGTLKNEDIFALWGNPDTSEETSSWKIET